MNQGVIWSHFQNQQIEAFKGANYRLRRLLNYAARYYSSPKAVNIGVGDGYLEITAKRRGWDIIAIDPDEGAIARLRTHNIDARVGFIEQIPIESRSVHVVFASEVFEHLSSESLFAGLSEISRILTSRGILIGTVPYNENLREQTVICPHCRTSFHRWGHAQSFTPEKMAALLQQWFEIERVGPVYFPSWNMLDLRSKISAALRIALLNPIGVHRSNENILFICRKRETCTVGTT